LPAEEVSKASSENEMERAILNKQEKNKKKVPGIVEPQHITSCKLEQNKKDIGHSRDRTWDPRVISTML
jgi:hypothetical protein